MATRVLSLMAVAVLTGALVGAEEAKFDAKCLVAGSPAAKADKFAEYKGGKVYFCCDNCKAKFTADKDKFAVAANHQLASTKQVKQTKCPYSGQPCDASKSVEVGGVSVAFCCDGCKSKTAAADAAKQKEMVFSNAAFDKAFEIIKK